jgi:hypothetical protein
LSQNGAWLFDKRPEKNDVKGSIIDVIAGLRLVFRQGSVENFKENLISVNNSLAKFHAKNYF